MTPQATLREFETSSRDYAGLDELTEAEREVYEAVVIDKRIGPRPLARKTDRSPGTISNLLRRARNKIDERGTS